MQPPPRHAPTQPGFPAQGLYDPANEHDACGVAFVADMHGRRSNEIVRDALTALHNLDHRGAQGSEVNTGDGAGILLQIPDRFLREVVDFELPKPAAYAVGIVFLPTDDAEARTTVEAVERIAIEEDLRVLGWRDVPIQPDSLGATALSAMPKFSQLFVGGTHGELGLGLDDFDVVYAYPWSGEEPMMFDLMRAYGNSKARLLLHGDHGVNVYAGGRLISAAPEPAT